MQTQTNQSTRNDDATKTVAKQITALNTLLRGELSAVETYDQAIAQLTAEPDATLTENRDCHANRLPVLRQHIAALGGTADGSSGLWGTWAKLVERGASVLGRTSIIAALEEGEDVGLTDYRRLANDVDEASRSSIETKLLPAQKRTHDRMRTLKNVA